MKLLKHLLLSPIQKGGSIYVGINEKNKEIAGINISKETIQNWLNKIKTKTEPAILPDIEKIVSKNKIVVKITIKEYPVKPVAIKGRYYVRRQNSNHRLTVQEISDIYI